jgi:predicted RND superfamily exporter protein
MQVNKMKIKFTRLIFLLLFGLIAVLYFPKIEFENSLESWVPTDSKEIVVYKEFLKEFGGDTLLVVVFQDPGCFQSEQVKKHLSGFRKDMQNLPGVNNVIRYPIPLYRLKKSPGENLHTFLIAFSPPSSANPNRPKLLKSIEEALEKIPIESHVAGTGVLHKAINDETQNYTFVFLSIGLLFLIALLLIVLKNFTAFLLTLGVSVGGILTLLIFSAILKIQLSMITVILPVLILFYGTSNSLHILSHRGNFKQVLIPCLVATGTTCTGFLVFLADPIPLLKDFSLLGISGLIGGFLWALVFFFPQQFSFQPRKFTNHLIRRFAALSRTTKPTILLILLGLVGAAIPGILKIRGEIYSLEVLSPSNERVLDHHFIEKEVGNYLPLEYTVETSKVKADRLIQWILSVYELEEVDGVLSYLNFFSVSEARKHGYISRDGNLGRITFFIPILSTMKGILLAKRIDRLAETDLGGCKPAINGYVTLYATVANELKNSFLKSVVLAFILVFFLLLVYLQSFRLFLAAILPNVLPVVFIIGLMGWLKISLNMVTVPIGCLLLCVIVDDTVHFLFWYKQTNDLEMTFVEAGPGIFMTSVILIVGFSVFLLASSPPIRYFGILGITALLTALIGDLVLLPIILKKMESIGFRWLPK